MQFVWESLTDQNKQGYSETRADLRSPVARVTNYVSPFFANLFIGDKSLPDYPGATPSLPFFGYSTSFDLGRIYEFAFRVIGRDAAI